MFETKRIDIYLLLLNILLIIFSFGMIASVSPSSLLNHFVYALVALVFMVIFSIIDTEIIITLSPIIYISSLIFLILPFFLGTVTRGSVRWIPIGTYTIQPSEIIKPFLCVFSAWFWGKREYSFFNFLKYGMIFFPAIFLIFIQPDLGSTLVVLSIFFCGFLLSGVNFKQLSYFGFAFLLFLPILWFSLKDYQRIRFLHFLNPAVDPLGEGYNQIQAKITVGSGKFIGWGLGKGTQSHLAFLPEKHTDFIFSSMAEEFGFVGSVFLLLLYLLTFLRILKIAGSLSSRPKTILILSLLSSLFFQTVVNIGMNIGILPITGITLPLFSYGGSSLLATMICFGMIQNIFRQNRENQIFSIRHF